MIVPTDSNDFQENAIPPFTNFGQFGYGKMDNRVFEQDTYWVDIAGEPHLIEEMPSDYRLNVIMFLEENKEYFFGQTIMRTAAEVVCDTLDGKINSELLLLELGMGSTLDATPDEWLHSTPLMRKLRQLEKV